MIYKKGPCSLYQRVDALGGFSISVAFIGYIILQE